MDDKSMTELMTRDQFWRKQYRENRYLIGLTEREIDLRVADIMTNCTTLTDDGLIGLSPVPWIELFTHINEEIIIRPMSFPIVRALGGRVAIPKPNTPILGPIIRARYPKGVPAKFTLFKYGKREHLEPMLKSGAVRICPASFYDKESLNVARRDKEMEFEKIVGHRRYRYRSANDFYMFCSSIVHFDRLFWDFEADSVLIIYDPHAFFSRLAKALDERSLDVYISRVSYLDPTLLGEETHVRDIALVKHMRFAYQFEHRFIAKSPTEERLEMRHLQLGPLDDVAELLVPPREEERAR